MLRQIGVIGAGVMGSGVAQNLAQTGHQVILLDVSNEILERTRREIEKNVRLLPLFQQADCSPDEVLKNIRFSTDYRLLAEADYVVENATEKWEIKRDIHTRIDAICPEHCIFAANTSTISITRIASVTRRASQVIGVHFMNPVPMKPTVEVIRGFHTSEATIEATQSLLRAMGKEAIVVNDSPGFVTNRIMTLAINEAIFLVQEQVASPGEIDHMLKSCYGHKMGPLETADLIGLDTILLSMEGMYESFNDDKFRPCPLLRKMVDAGLLGRKSGQGFYAYPQSKRNSLR